MSKNLKLNNLNDLNKNNNRDTPEIGVLEWFHINNYEHVKKAVESLQSLGVTHLRTGISWADYFTENGEEWYDWLIPYLSSHFEILPCFLYTPPSIGIVEKTSSPPKNPKDYADFIDKIINRHGEHFEYVELWNEPNNRSEYDFIYDESWSVFTQMIRMASYWARHLGKKTVLGGMSPIDPNWLKLMASNNALEFIDVIGVHGFPDVFEYPGKDWKIRIAEVNDVLETFNLNLPVWITETGYSTWRYDERIQIQKFIEATNAPVERIYWYSLTDLSKKRATVDGLHSDEREYHFGLINEEGNQKLLYRLWNDGGLDNIISNQWLTSRNSIQLKPSEEHVLITGGAGFIGTNLAHRLLSEGVRVTVYDNLSRPGVENNLKWLKAQHPSLLNTVVADVRDEITLEKEVRNVSHVFHFAAQVAVTTSLKNPKYDNDVNLNGTINVLEAIRKSSNRPSLVFTSTNKVYGNLQNIEIRKNGARYHPVDEQIKLNGITEDFNLDFHSPYGNSKGAADQYILDYTRSYDLKNVVFRMSCIYGPHQFGTEDQGWVAHFILKALKKEQITLFGNGMQVRDILYVDDLVNAFLLAWGNIDNLKGQAFNIGGGVSNAVSLLELIKLLENLQEEKIPVTLKDWRKGDQKYYVSDYSRFQHATGWEPEFTFRKGVVNLYNWLKKYYSSPKWYKSLNKTSALV
ncbi:MAG: NAD-dependent epimerase/dehydratase family protein [Prolixibacteraceae bacterium]